MRISYYIDNSTLPNVIHPEEYLASNPGIGGTEYAIITISYLMSKQNGFNVILFSTSPILIKGSEVQNEVVDNLESAITKADELDITAIVFPNVGLSNPYVLKDIKHQVKLILWCHIFCPDNLMTFFSKHHVIDRYINVGEEQLDVMRDHPEFAKSDYIYNGIKVFSDYDNLTPFMGRENVVTYIGNIKPYKGFHVLAKAWKRVLDAVPDAQLYVIGSGKLYDRNVRLGKYNIAVEGYENEFMPYLTDERGDILDSVHFLGIMGLEKFEVLKRTKVGVPNPSGVSETFGFSAVEMQMMGCLCATKRCPGYLDTVAPTGILYNNEENLASAIIQLLKREDNDLASTYKFLNDKFSFEVVIKDWIKLFLSLENGGERIHPISSRNMSYHYKWLKEYIRKWKACMPIFKYAPTVERFIAFYVRLSNPFK
jgi:glycosyltransferase involved in cell wall biosynthesis